MLQMSKTGIFRCHRFTYYVFINTCCFASNRWPKPSRRLATSVCCRILDSLWCLTASLSCCAKTSTMRLCPHTLPPFAARRSSETNDWSSVVGTDFHLVNISRKIHTLVCTICNKFRKLNTDNMRQLREV